jgi:hypothetical protein
MIGMAGVSRLRGKALCLIFLKEARATSYVVCSRVKPLIGRPPVSLQ